MQNSAWLTEQPMAWLLVNDNMPDVNDGPAVSAVPIPAAAFMFAPAMLGFAALRRKAKNSVA